MITKENFASKSRTFFVPCVCHTLNLVVYDVAAVSYEVVGCFDLVQELWTFASGSLKRREVMKRHLKTFSLKPLSATRWSSRLVSVKPLRFQLSLAEITESENFDMMTKQKAQALLDKIKIFKFICSIIIW